MKKEQEDEGQGFRSLTYQGVRTLGLIVPLARVLGGGNRFMGVSEYTVLR